MVGHKRSRGGRAKGSADGSWPSSTTCCRVLRSPQARPSRSQYPGTERRAGWESVALPKPPGSWIKVRKQQRFDTPIFPISSRFLRTYVRRGLKDSGRGRVFAMPRARKRIKRGTGWDGPTCTVGIAGTDDEYAGLERCLVALLQESDGEKEPFLQETSAPRFLPPPPTPSPSLP